MTTLLRICDSVGDCRAKVEVRDLAGAGRLTAVEGFAVINYITYSPDGRWLLFQAVRDRLFGSYLVPALGGEARFLGCCYASFLGRGDTIWDRSPTTMASSTFWYGRRHLCGHRNQ